MTRRKPTTKEKNFQEKTIASPLAALISVKMSSFSDAPMFFKEDAEADVARLKQLQRDDPIAWQDAVNTSRALVESVKDNDIEELRRVVANADEGELIQAFTIQSFVMALKASSLEMVQQFVDWGMPLQSPSLSQVLHLVCELVNRENFSSSWRILKVLAEGNCYGALDINTPRSSDGVDSSRFRVFGFSRFRVH
eukprot:symbB.v1.2.035977.t1/scaffold4963.1/size32391/1